MGALHLAEGAGQLLVPPLERAVAGLDPLQVLVALVGRRLQLVEARPHLPVLPLKLNQHRAELVLYNTDQPVTYYTHRSTQPAPRGTRPLQHRPTGELLHTQINSTSTARNSSSNTDQPVTYYTHRPTSELLHTQTNQ